MTTDDIKNNTDLLDFDYFWKEHIRYLPQVNRNNEDDIKQLSKEIHNIISSVVAQQLRYAKDASFEF